MGLFIFILVLLGAIGCIVGKSAHNSSNYNRVWRCPHGYDSFGCSASCPLYNNCLDGGEDAFIARRVEHESYLFHENTTPTDHNEDGDWRTVYMDDERYDDREEDEIYDDDREDNGW